MEHDGKFPTGELVDKLVALMRRTRTIGEKEALVARHSLCGARRIGEMTHDEAVALHVSLMETDEAMDRMRKKIIAMAHQLGWKNLDGSGKADYARIDKWMCTYRQRSMNLQNHAQLAETVTQFTEMFKAEIKERRVAP